MNILCIHGVNSPKGTWEKDFAWLGTVGHVDYAQYPTKNIMGDYLRFILSGERRLACFDALLGSLVMKKYDLIVTHSFGQVVLDFLRQTVEFTTPVVNLGGPFSHPVVGWPLRRYMLDSRSDTIVIVNKADGIPTFFGGHIKIPSKKTIEIDVDVLGDDHEVRIYLASREVQDAILEVAKEKK